jgi:hypothetical protein
VASASEVPPNLHTFTDMTGHLQKGRTTPRRAL